jgi:ribosomal protein S18 acetylase RimI-like enzyme
MSVRRATRSDIRRLVDLMTEVVDQHADHMPQVFRRAKREDIVEYLNEMLDAEDTRVFVACAGPEVVGYMLLMVDDDPGSPFFLPRRLLYIEALAVTAAHRRQGHGAALLDTAWRVAAELGLDRVEFETWGFNEQAHEYFRARGFETLSLRMTARV